ncbi:MAG: hypothetical protein IT262_22680 [Saprospiraceae bacterium]|nr:hypothetical protein [Saprospiraceae bacterium]
MAKKILFMLIQQLYQFLLLSTGKRVYFVLIISCTCFSGLFAQFDSNSKKLQISVHANFGAALSLPKHNNSILFVPANTSPYYGLLVNGNYRKINVETGLQNFTYRVSMAVEDADVQTKHFASFNNVYTGYHRFHSSIGYTIYLKNNYFAFEPYLSGGMLFTSSGYSNISTGSTGNYIQPNDTNITTFTYGIQRTQKRIFDAGFGAKFKYKYKKLTVAFNVEYFQAFSPWSTLYGVYDRRSILYGALHAMQSFRSSDKNVIAGISVGWSIYN